MGMAIVTKTVRKPRYKGTSVCQVCGAEYVNKGGWVKGYNETNGTSPSRFHKTRDVPKDICPVCN